MASITPRIRTLLRQATRVADAGKRAAAEKLYREILDEAPETPAAWLGLADVLADPAEQRAAYQNALDLEPENAAAMAGLSRLDGELVEAVAAPAAPPSDGAQAAAVLDEALSDKPQPSGVKAFPAPIPEPVPAPDVLLCANHPNRRTHLRCNRCGKPICSACANPTPVGYRCPECIREQEDVFYTARPLDYALSAAVALPLALLGAFLASAVGFWAIFVAPVVGSVIGRVCFRLAGRRRGRWLPHLVAA
ncbi:MAG: B-box zinc finger protein, partial [Candidatus Promineifilaceae bacterium]